MKNSFAATRSHHLKETAEDYVELVAELIETKGAARTCDIAEKLGVSHVTVVRTIQRLQQKGYVQTSSHKPVTLTEAGKKLASSCKQRHDFLLSYLTAIGVSPETAAIDVEGMEHHVSEETLNAFRLQMETNG